MPLRLPRADVAERLADRLHALDYTVEGVRSLLGPVAAGALERGSAVVARQALRADPSPLSCVTRLFLLAEEVPAAQATSVLSDTAALADLLVGGDAVSSRLELAPYNADGTDWLLASDWSPTRSGRPAAVDHVLGAGGASLMLAQCTVRPGVEQALDLGTGCGIQALHLVEHCATVVATDVSPRCLEVAAFNAALNRVTVDLRMGSLFDPVASDRFDLIVSNPPFVVGSPGGHLHDYRDSGLPGDEVCARLVSGAEVHLADGGWCQLLANWEVHGGEEWSAGPRRWLADSGLDAWVLQREVQDPAAYAETWLRDAGVDGGPDHDSRYQAWYSGLRARDVVGVGFGLVSLRAGGHDEPVRRFQHADQQLAQPVGGEVAAWFARQDFLAQARGADLLRARLELADDVRVDLRMRPGRADPEEELALREGGFRWTATLDPFGVDLLGRITGGRPVGEAVAEVAHDRGVDVEQALAAAVPVLRRMVEEGFCQPVA